MRALSGTYSYSRTSCITGSALLLALLLAETCAASLPPPPSPADKWLYPDVNTLPTFNYLDIVNASWTSNFVAPYLLLRCQHPNDAIHYAYRTSFWLPVLAPSQSNAAIQHTTSLSQQQARLSCPSMMEMPGCATSKCPT